MEHMYPECFATPLHRWAERAAFSQVRTIYGGSDGGTAVYGGGKVLPHRFHTVPKRVQTVLNSFKPFQTVSDNLQNQIQTSSKQV